MDLIAVAVVLFGSLAVLTPLQRRFHGSWVPLSPAQLESLGDNCVCVYGIDNNMIYTILSNNKHLLLVPGPNIFSNGAYMIVWFLDRMFESRWPSLFYDT